MSALENQKRLNVINELVTTETTYVEKLELLNEYFVQPLLTKKWPIMKNPAVAIFLSNVETLFTFHDKFLKDVRLLWENERGGVDASPVEEDTGNLEDVLKKCHTGGVGQLFLNYIGLFRLYHPYSRIYDVAMPLFVDCKDGHFTFFMQDTEIKIRQTMSSLAICPIQRIPRYILLLKEISKFYDESHPDSHSLSEAIEELDNSTKLINESVRGRHQLQELCILEKKFSSNTTLEIVKLGRSLLKEGILNKVCKNSSKPYYFHLFSDILVYSEETNVGYKPHKALDLYNMEIETENTTGQGMRIRVVSGEHSISINFMNDQNQHEWIQSLRFAIKSQDRSGVDIPFYWQNDDEIDECQVCEGNFSLVNRRHTCKNCGTIACGNCSKHKLLIPRVNKKSSIRVCDKCFEKKVNEGADENRNQPKDVPKLQSAEFLVQKKFTKKDLIVELVRTEKEFLIRLDLLSKLFVQPTLQDLYISMASDSSSSSTFLSASKSAVLNPKVAVLFTNIEQISTLNHELSKVIEKRMLGWDDDTSSIGDLFIQYAPLLKVYSQYARYHHYASLELAKDKFPALIEAAEKHPVAIDYGLHVEEFLQLPMQRIPIYELFIYEMEKRTSKESEDSSFLKIALEFVRDCTVHINASREIQGKLDVLRDLEKQFSSQVSLVAPHRELIKTGYLTKCDRRGNGRRYIFHLFNDLFIYSKESMVGLQLRRSMEVSRIRLVDQEDTKQLKNAFAINSTEKSFLVYADSKDMKDEWIRNINKVSTQLFSSGRSSNFSDSKNGGSSTGMSSSTRSGRRQFGKSVDFTQKKSSRRTFSTSLGITQPISPSKNDEFSVSTDHSYSSTTADEQIIIVKDYNGEEFSVDLSRAPVYSFSKHIKTCSVCNEDLKIMRRNHCDACGRAVCKSCSQKRVILPHCSDRPKKVCDSCYSAMEIFNVLTNDSSTPNTAAIHFDQIAEI